VTARRLVPEPFDTGLVPNVPAMPAGKPVSDRFTAARKPFNAAMVAVIVGFDAPAITGIVDAEVVRVKSPDTVRVTGLAYAVALEEVPLKTTVYVPGGVLVDVVMETATLPEVVVDDGVKCAEAPLGKPSAEKRTVGVSRLAPAILFLIASTRLSIWRTSRSVGLSPSALATSICIRNLPFPLFETLAR